jgi:hypothetical protein
VSRADEVAEALAGALHRQTRVLERIDRRHRHEDEAAALDRAMRPRPREPRRLTSPFLLSTIPQFLAPFEREVPGEFWSFEGEQVVVSCPCGVDPAPAVPLGGTLECPGEDCGRWYLATRNTLFCANEATIAATLDPPEPEAP